MPTPLNTQVVVVSSKPQCVNPRCRKATVAAGCSNGMCAACCRAALAACTFANHRKKRLALDQAAASTQPAGPSNGPWTLKRPAAVEPFAPCPPLPSQPPSTAVGSPLEPLPSTDPIATSLSSQATDSSPAISPPSTARYFATSMDPEWLAQWKASAARQEEKLRGEAAQRENRRKIAQSVTVWYWNKTLADDVLY
ncbi:hypothetical protein K466DRAFT_602047 [Polyporus arcularius HHB13444]|uniref:Uncharacterized protein n=1 Tax=Polyporus arcularius HHB13444 TaxID=1314778 RepID=A0A5C3P085_9APHY|nr:hypothetical protein K466DRAFT_603845 [Polyporus arcularius HHB13444]TFK84372.1 hypothetical protein K466DRAFT_602047 [Polyporus arcularius HHB13444]